MNYKPEGCKILVDADKAEETTKGGLIIPKTVQASEQVRITQGTVVAIGPTAVANFRGAGDEDQPLKVGDRILFAKYGGFYLNIDRDHDYRFINDEDVIARIDD